MTNKTEYRKLNIVKDVPPTLRERESKKYKKDLAFAKFVVKFPWLFRHTAKLAKARIIISRDEMIDLGLKEGENRYPGVHGSIIKSNYDPYDQVNMFENDIEDIMIEFRKILAIEVEKILHGLSYEELKSLELELNEIV